MFGSYSYNYIRLWYKHIWYRFKTLSLFRFIAKHWVALRLKWEARLRREGRNLSPFKMTWRRARRRAKWDEQHRKHVTRHDPNADVEEFDAKRRAKRLAAYEKHLASQPVPEMRDADMSTYSPGNGPMGVAEVNAAVAKAKDACRGVIGVDGHTIGVARHVMIYEGDKEKS